MKDRLFASMIVLLLAGMAVVGSLAVARFCDREPTQMVPVIDPQAGEMYQQRMQATKVLLRTSDMYGATR
jgi:hypothetical protein